MELEQQLLTSKEWSYNNKGNEVRTTTIDQQGMKFREASTDKQGMK